MMDIYICEDDLSQLQFIKNRIEDCIKFDQVEMQIVAATDNPTEILEKAERSRNCGLYFLDIDLNRPETNGVLLAQNIRKIEPRCFIVFITSHIELCFYTYQYKVEALDFIVKESPEKIKTKIHECMLNAWEKHTGGYNTYRNMYTAVMPDGKKISVRYEDIMYFKTSSAPHKITLYARNRAIDIPGLLNAIEEELNSDFLRCHRGVIVNLRNIVDIDYENCRIMMNDGSSCPYSVRRKRELKKRYNAML